jgi:hypothetical protein
MTTFSSALASFGEFLWGTTIQLCAGGCRAFFGAKSCFGRGPKGREVGQQAF